MAVQFYHKQSDLDAAKDFLEARIENNESVIYIATNELDHFVGFVQLFPSFSSTRMKRFWIFCYLNETKKGGVPMGQERRTRIFKKEKQLADCRR